MAFCSSSGDTSTAQTSPTSTISQVTLKTAPWGIQEGLVRADAHTLEHLIHVGGVAHVFEGANLSKRVLAVKRDAYVTT
eukprot:3451650-Pleurochrysis_carterae.AAC.1